MDIGKSDSVERYQNLGHKSPSRGKKGPKEGSFFKKNSNNNTDNRNKLGDWSSRLDTNPTLSNRGKINIYSIGGVFPNSTTNKAFVEKNKTTGKNLIGNEKN